MKLIKTMKVTRKVIKLVFSPDDVSKRLDDLNSIMDGYNEAMAVCRKYVEHFEKRTECHSVVWDSIYEMAKSAVAKIGGIK